MPWRPSASAQVRASAICPTAAAAWLSSSLSEPRGSFSTARPSAIAPDDTTRMSRFSPCSRAMSLGERGEPVLVDAAGRGIDQQRRADLDDDAAEIGEGGEFAGHDVYLQQGTGGDASGKAHYA